MYSWRTGLVFLSGKPSYSGRDPPHDRRFVIDRRDDDVSLATFLSSTNNKRGAIALAGSAGRIYNLSSNTGGRTDEQQRLRSVVSQQPLLMTFYAVISYQDLTSTWLISYCRVSK